MQHGMHNSIELLKVESQLLDRELKYHYLIADRDAQPAVDLPPNLIANFRALCTPSDAHAGARHLIPFTKRAGQ